MDSGISLSIGINVNVNVNVSLRLSVNVSLRLRISLRISIGINVNVSLRLRISISLRISNDTPSGADRTPFIDRELLFSHFLLSTKYNRMRPILIFLFLFSGALSRPNELVAQTRFGLGFQAYPAGVIGVGQVIIPTSEHVSVRLLAGYNATDRRDFGEHDDETGGGPGLALELDRYFARDKRGFFVGARADIWFLDIDWENERIDGGETGETSVTVFQPTGVVGYRTGSSLSGVAIDFTLALGAEINVNTSGEPVGEGAIFLAGITLVFQGSRNLPREGLHLNARDYRKW